MQFGRVQDLRGRDLSLPPDDPANLRVLRQGARGRSGQTPLIGLREEAAQPGPLDIHLGLPLWNNDLMARALCPPGTPRAGRLKGYARQLNAVELNSSGYGLAPANARAWAAATPPGFRFHPKVPRDVSHATDLTRMGDAYAAFARAAEEFGDRLGTALLQFPESFGPWRFRELEAFLRAQAGRLPLAVEVRGREWFGGRGAREAFFGLLEELGMIAAITDSPGRRDAVHMRLTAPEAYVRFCGHDRSPPDLARLDDWVERIRTWAGQGLRRLHLFLHHEPEHISVAWAVDFAAALNRALGASLSVPRLHPEVESEAPQLDLFAT